LLQQLLCKKAITILFDLSKNYFFVISSGSQGGAETQLSLLISYLLSNFNAKIYLYILGRGDYLSCKLSSESVFIYQCTSNQAIFSRIFSLFSCFHNICSTIDSLDSSSIILHGWLSLGNIFTFLVKLYTRLPDRVIFSHRSSFFLFQSISSQTLLFLELLVSFISRGSILHVANSSTVFRHFLVRMLIHKKYSFVIPNGFSTNHVIRSSGDPTFHQYLSLSLQAKPLKLLCVSRFSPEKRHSLLFKALSKFDSPYTLTCIGSGCTYSNVKFADLASTYHIYPVAFETTSRLNEYYASSDFTVLFSRTESFPNVLVESMLNSTPCISFDVGEASNIIGNSGYLIPNSGLSAILEVFNSAFYASQTCELSNLRSLSYQRASNCFSSHSMGKLYLDLYETHF
jgi:glycosyltransferase involved in cell wall biosynthesis